MVTVRGLEGYFASFKIFQGKVQIVGSSFDIFDKNRRLPKVFAVNFDSHSVGVRGDRNRCGLLGLFEPENLPAAESVRGAKFAADNGLGSAQKLDFGLVNLLAADQFQVVLTGGKIVLLEWGRVQKLVVKKNLGGGVRGFDQKRSRRCNRFEIFKNKKAGGGQGGYSHKKQEGF